MPEHNLADPLTMPDAAHREATSPEKMLDNPIWNALRTDHAGLAVGNDQARRYPAFIGPLSGIPDQSPTSYEALRPLAGLDGVVVLFSVEPPQLTPGWTSIRGGQIYQMRLSGPWHPTTTRVADPAIRRLTTADAPAMVELAELTEPGPFRLRTLELGSFFGAFDGEKLVAMAGKRMHLPGYVEVSGVCTHPDARGRGYAAALMSLVIDEIVRDGKAPFLHVMIDNRAAQHVYEKLGFRVRQTFHLAVVRNEG